MSPNVTLLLLSLFLSAAVFATAQPLVGGWTPIPTKNLTDPHVQEIAQYAVSEHNSKEKGTLKLEKVVKGESQVVAGIQYRLVLDTTTGAGAASQKYVAVVWEKEWLHFRKLISFNLANQN